MWLFGSWLAWQKTLLTYKNTFASLANNFYFQQNWFPCSSIFWNTWHQQPEGTSAVKSGSSCPSPSGQLTGSVQYQFCHQKHQRLLTHEFRINDGRTPDTGRKKWSCAVPAWTSKDPAIPGWLLQPNWLLCFCSCLLGSRWGAGYTPKTGGW